MDRSDQAPFFKTLQAHKRLEKILKRSRIAHNLGPKLWDKSIKTQVLTRTIVKGHQDASFIPPRGG